MCKRRYSSEENNFFLQSWKYKKERYNPWCVNRLIKLTVTHSARHNKDLPVPMLSQITRDFVFKWELLGIQSQAKWNVVNVWPLIKPFHRGEFTALEGEKNTYMVFSSPT